MLTDRCTGQFTGEFELNSECDTKSHDIIVASHECLELCVYGTWSVMIHLTLACQNFGIVGVVYIYIYISAPNYFSVNAEGANCNLVFILSRAVLGVNFMMCETLCIKILFV